MILKIEITPVYRMASLALFEICINGSKSREVKQIRKEKDGTEYLMYSKKKLYIKEFGKISEYENSNQLKLC